MPGLTIGDTIPDLEAECTHGKIKLHEFMGDSWTILFSHPVCTIELGKMAAYSEEFAKRDVKLLGLSCDDVQSLKECIIDNNNEACTAPAGCKVTYPILADPNRDIIKQLNMVDPDQKDSSGKPMPSLALHIVSPDKIIKLSFLYPASTGRNMDEVLRVLDSLQKAMKHKVATPADHCKPGDEVVIALECVERAGQRDVSSGGFDTADLPSKSNV